MKQLAYIIALLLFPLAAIADDVEIDGIWYNLVRKAKVAEVTWPKDYSKYAGDIEIPSSVEYNGIKYNVTIIGESAFQFSDATSIVIPNSVKTIGYDAFGMSENLTSVTIPNSVTTIGEFAFDNCKSLSGITIPESVTSISNHTFFNCISLTSIIIPPSITSIGKEAFSGAGLTSITIPATVTEIGEAAFAYCKKLDNVSVEEGNPYYDSRDNCNAVIETATNTLLVGTKNTVITSNITDIGYLAFSGREMATIDIPDHVTKIHNDAFRASGLTSITLPSSINSINDRVFCDCEGLTEITIPEKIKSVGFRAFDGCLNLTTVTIGSGVRGIGDRAFANCPEITDVYCLAEDVPSTYENAFENSEIRFATLYVPLGTEPFYRAVEPWKDFMEIIEMQVMKTVPIGKALVAGYSSDKALDFTNSDVSAWIATGVRGGNILMSRVDIVPANTGIYVKASKAGNYDVPTTMEKSYYVNMFKPVVTAMTVQPTVTIDGVTYQTLSFALSKETGKPGFFPNTEAKDYGNNKMYLQLPEWVLDSSSVNDGEMTTDESEPVTIGTLGVAGFSSNKNLDFTNTDVEAWVATGFKGGNVLLSRVYAVPAGTGIYVKAKKTLTASTTFQIPVTTEVPYYVNLFVGLPDGGTVAPIEFVDDMTMQTLTFATSKTTGKPAFFPNTEDKTYGAGKMYLRLPIDLIETDYARSLGLVFMDDDNVGLMESETTGISDASHLNDKGQMKNDKRGNGDYKSPVTDEVFNLNGQRLMTPRKGLNIVGGRKVVIK